MKRRIFIQLMTAALANLKLPLGDIVQIASGVKTVGITLVKPNEIEEGNLLIAFISSENVNAPHDWIEEILPDEPYMSVFHKLADENEPDNYLFVTPQPGELFGAMLNIAGAEGSTNNKTIEIASLTQSWFIK